MGYERPRIVRRERVEALLGDTAQSDVNPPPDGIPSDVHKKDNVVPVAWAGEAVGYESPAIVGRERIEAMLMTVAQSDDNPPPDGAISDVNVKGNVVPVRW
jgi:hypothetical protein